MPYENIPARTSASLSCSKMRASTEPTIPKCSCCCTRERFSPKLSSSFIRVTSCAIPELLVRERFTRACSSSSLDVRRLLVWVSE